MTKLENMLEEIKLKLDKFEAEMKEEPKVWIPKTGDVVEVTNEENWPIVPTLVRSAGFISLGNLIVIQNDGGYYVSGWKLWRPVEIKKKGIKLIRINGYHTAQFMNKFDSIEIPISSELCERLAGKTLFDGEVIEI